MKILIVDDKKESLYTLKILLKRSGYEVIQASNGIEALERIKSEHPDMIITDILMPKMDGFQLCRKVKEDKKLKRIPFVFYTATYTDPKDEEFALSLGAERFIRKPVASEKFIAILKEIIKKHEEGKLLPSKKLPKEEKTYFKTYNERLIKKLEDKLLQLEKKQTFIKSVIETMPVSLLVVNPDATIKAVNPRTCELLGYKEKELVGKSVETVLNHTVVADTILNGVGLEKLIKNGAIRNERIMYSTKKGKEIPMAVSESAVKDEAGKLEYIVIVAKDMRGILKLEEEKRKTEVAAAAAAAEKFKRELAEKTAKEIEAVNRQLVVAQKQLQDKIVELERFNKITMGREMRILELKEEVARLKGEKVPAPPIPKVKPITPTAKKTKKTKPKPKPKPKP